MLPLEPGDVVSWFCKVTHCLPIAEIVMLPRRMYDLPLVRVGRDMNARRKGQEEISLSGARNDCFGVYEDKHGGAAFLAASLVATSPLHVIMVFGPLAQRIMSWWHYRLGDLVFEAKGTRE